jgi:hypothetical protein
VRLIVICACLWSTLASADKPQYPIKAVIPDSITRLFPEKADSIKSVLATTDFEFEYTVRPDLRSGYDFSKNNVDLIVYANKTEPSNFNPIKILPPVDTLNLWWWTANPELCKLSKAERFQMPVVGIQGLKFYEEMIFPHFKHHVGIPKVGNLVKLLLRDRAQFTIGSKPGIQLLDDIDQITQCEDDEPFLTINFYTHIHPDYAHTVPAIEAAYQKAFGNLEPR